MGVSVTYHIGSDHTATCHAPDTSEHTLPACATTDILRQVNFEHSRMKEGAHTRTRVSYRITIRIEFEMPADRGPIF